MSLRAIRNLQKTISFRMAVWYSAIFIVSCIAFYFVGSFLLSTSLREKDHELIASKLSEYGAQYQKSGLNGLKNSIAPETGKFLVRVTDAQQRTLFLALPTNFYEEDEGHRAKFDLRTLENRAVKIPEDELPSYDQEDVLEITAARLPGGQALQIGKSTEEREDIIEKFQDVLSLVVAAVLIIGIAGGIFLSYRALEPVRQLTRLTHTIVDTGKIDARVPVRGKQDELNELASLFNQMLEKIETLIKGMKDSLDNVAHDLRTPVTRLRASAEAALNSNGNIDHYKESLSDCLEESERIMTMLNTLMDISEAETGVMQLHPEPLEIATLVEDIVDLYRYVADEKKITISVHAPQKIYLTADRNRIQQVIANLLDNALKYTPVKGHVSVEAMRRNGEMILTIQDSGIGIPADELSKVWQRLYRGDKSRSQRGLGLGLSFVKAIINAHQGSIDVFSEPGKGSKFTVHLPFSKNAENC